LEPTAIAAAFGDDRVRRALADTATASAV